jgi:thermitase
MKYKLRNKSSSFLGRLKPLLFTAVIQLFGGSLAIAQDLDIRLGGKTIKLKKKEDTYAVAFSSKDTTIIQDLKAQGLSFSYKTIIEDNRYAIYLTEDFNRLNQTIRQFNASSPNDAATSPVYEYGNSLNILKNEFIIKFRDDVEQAYIDNLFKRKKIKIVSINTYFKNQYLITFEGMNASKAVKKLPVEDPFIEYAEPNLVQIIKNRPSSLGYRKQDYNNSDSISQLTPNDEFLNRQWYLNNTSNPNFDVRAIDGWRISKGVEDIIIAIIDEGVDTLHPDLKDKIVSQFDAVENDNDQQPQDNAGHGTSCAGIAAASTNNGLGVSGIGWNNKIMPIRIAKVNSGGRWETNANIIANGILEAVNRGARVLSCSWGGGTPSSYINSSIDYAISKNCIVVFAAGNDASSVNYPANLSLEKKIITVAATNEWDESKSRTSQDGEDWWGTNFGPEIVVSAPGVHMTTTDITGDGKGYEPDSDYIFDFNGTSSSTPLVAGAIALLLSRDSNLTVDGIIELIKNNSDDLGDPGFDNHFGFGRLNVLKLLRTIAD